MRLLLLVYALIAGTVSGGFAACPDNMKFFHQTNSCFGVLTTTMTYYDCRASCRKIKGGANNKDPGHVAWILDKKTGDFIKGWLPRRRTWIGLSDAVEKEKFFWEDMKSPNEAMYFNWGQDEPSKSKYYLNVIIETTGDWKKYYFEWKASCLCEVDAAVPPVQMSSTHPLQVGTLVRNAVSCSFGDNWTSVSFYLPNGNSEVIRCYKHSSGDPCTTYVLGYSGKMSGNHKIEVDISTVQRHDEGIWKCQVRYNDTVVSEAEQDVKVFEPAKEINCNHTLTPGNLTVSCVTPRIYPTAVCSWKYKQDDKAFQRVIGQLRPAHTPRTDDTINARFFESTCTLSRIIDDGFTFLPGDLTFQVTMDPTIKDLDTLPAYSGTLKEHTVEIVAPREPKFKYTIGGIRLANEITLTDGDHTLLTCFVYHGTPRVYETRIDCDFAFVEHKSNGQYDRSITRPGISLVMNLTAQAWLDGKKCRCSGHHLIGWTKKAEFTINIDSPASIVYFGPQDRSYRPQPDATYTYFERQTIKLLCRITGKPLPTATIRRLGASQALDAKQFNKDFKYEFTTKCSDTGNYICQASNLVGGQRVNVNKTMRLNVSCKPKLCTDKDSGMAVGANVGDQARVRFCVYANPEPRMDLFWLLIMKTGRWVNAKDYAVEFTTVVGAEGTLSIDYKMGEDTFGNYSVYYDNAPFASFEVVLKGPPFCPKEIDVANVSEHEASLQWTKAPSHEFGESFIIFQLGDGEPNKELAEIVVTNETMGVRKLSYNLTGLDHGTTYNLSVGTKNEHGQRLCNDKRFNLTTTEPVVTRAVESDDSSNTSIWIIVGVVLIIIVIFVIIVIIVVTWRKRKDQTKDTAGTAVSDADGQGQIVYARADKKFKPKAATRQPEEGEASGETVYAQVDKKKKKNDGDNETPGGTYANTSQINKAMFDDTSQATWNSGSVYANTSSLINDLQQAEASGSFKKSNDNELTYTTVTVNPGKKTSIHEDNKAFSTKKKSKRNADLTYTTVTVTPGRKVSINDGNQTSSAKKVTYDPVEYSSIDHLATKQKAIELEGGASVEPIISDEGKADLTYTSVNVTPSKKVALNDDIQPASTKMVTYDPVEYSSIDALATKEKEHEIMEAPGTAGTVEVSQECGGQGMNTTIM